MKNAFDLLEEREREKRQEKYNDYLNNLNNPDELQSEQDLMKEEANLIGGALKKQQDFGSYLSTIETHQKQQEDDELSNTSTDFTYPEPDVQHTKAEKSQMIAPKKFHQERQIAQPVSAVQPPKSKNRYRDQRASFANQKAASLDDEMSQSAKKPVNEQMKPLKPAKRLNRQKTQEIPPEKRIIKQSPKSGVTLDDFEILKVIDKGSFGKVFLVQVKATGKLYAMKRIRKDILIEKGQIENTYNERDILLKTDHPFLLGMDYVFQNDFRIYFFLEFIRGGNMYQNLFKVKRFTEDQTKFYAAQLVLAIGVLHKHKIVHRDLKPENVLLQEDGYIKLADFGLAKFLTGPSQSTATFCGTPEYLAPEIIKSNSHSYGVDWWTLGVLTYELVTGRPPFFNQNHKKLGSLIVKGSIIFPDPVKHKIQMSEDVKTFISSLLHKDPKLRLGVNGPEEIMAHPWFEGFDFPSLLRKEMRAPYKPVCKSESAIVRETKSRPEPHFKKRETMIDPSTKKMIQKHDDKFAKF